MTWIEYFVSRVYVALCYYACCLLPVNRRKVVFASPRGERLSGNLLFLYQGLKERYPSLEYTFILERYGYSLGEKIRYGLGLAKGAYHLATARLFLVDNAYFPLHVVRHRRATQVVQLWHAVGAMKKFGADAPDPSRKQENKFVHKHYDWAVVGSPFAVAPYASAFAMDPGRVLPLGCPRTDFLFDGAAMARARAAILAAYPQLVGRRVVLYAPTYRGQGVDKRQPDLLDPAQLRAVLGSQWALVYKPHPTTPADRLAGYDAVADARFDINEWFTLADVLVTDYSSSAIEYAVLNKPLVLLAPDAARYERDPGFYFDFETEMAGFRAENTAAVGQYIAGGRWDLSAYPAFVARHFAYLDGQNTRRVVQFLSQWLNEER